MERTYSLKGLDCPNCAAKIETEVGALPGVTRSVVNLMKQTLKVTAEGDGEELTEAVARIVKKHEPEIEVLLITGKASEADPGHSHEHGHSREHEHGHEHGHDHGDEDGEEGSNVLRLLRLIAAGLVFLAGVILPRFTEIPEWARFALFAASWLIAGYDVVIGAVRGIFRGEFFDERFLMTVSTVGAFAIGEWPEAAAVMVLYQLGELFQDAAVDRSRESITALMDIRPDTARVKRGADWETVSPEDVEIGETILVQPGERVPLDGVVRVGTSSVDTRALTGESAPRIWQAGDTALSGCVIEDGVLEIEVTKEAGESTASKILELCESAAENKAPGERFITKFARIYTPVVCALALLLAVVPPLVTGGGWAEWIRRGCVVLAVSCPCALVISVPLTFFGGIGRASRSGVLVKGSATLETLASLDAVVFDKTGTLTRGEFEVTELHPADGVTEEELLGLAARAERFSNHPIARSVTGAYEELGGERIDEKDLTDAAEIAGRGVTVRWGGKTILAGNAAFMEENGVEYTRADEGCAAIYTAFGGRFAGWLGIEDLPKGDAEEAVLGLRSLGVRRIEMLTGDTEAAARKTADLLALDGHRSGLLPAGKVERIEEIMEEGCRCAFVGDGINDAPVLARADVGIAMGGLGSDAAIEAADAVLMTDEPSKLCDAVKISRKTKRIVRQNVWFAIAVKAVFILLGAFGLVGMWSAVAGDVGVMILAVLNALRVNKA